MDHVKRFSLKGIVFLDFDERRHVYVRLCQFLHYLIASFHDYFPSHAFGVDLSAWNTYAKQACHILNLIRAEHNTHVDVYINKLPLHASQIETMIQSFHNGDEYLHGLQIMSKKILNEIHPGTKRHCTFDCSRHVKFYKAVDPHQPQATDTTLALFDCVADNLYSNALLSIDEYISHLHGVNDEEHNTSPLTAIFSILAYTCHAEVYSDNLNRIYMHMKFVLRDMTVEPNEHAGHIYPLCLSLIDAITENITQHILVS